MTAPTRTVEAFSISHAQVLDGATTFLDAAYAAQDEDFDIYGVADASLEPDTGTFENPGDDAIQSRWQWINYADLNVQAGYFSFPLIATLTGRPVDTVGAEAQTVTITGNPTGGVFTLTYAGQTTADIAYNATAATVRARLEALSNLEPGDVTVTGSAGGPYTVTFTSGEDVAQITATATGLTGGTTPGVTVATATPGTGWVAHQTDLWHEDSFNVDDRPMMVKMPSKDSRGVALDMLLGLYKVSFAPITFNGPSYKEGLKINYNGTALRSLYNELGVAFPDGKTRFGQVLSISKTAPTP
jgi:hypothetical protein